MNRFALVLVVAGVVSIAVGAFLVAVPLGFTVAGVEALCAAYAISYMEARRR